MMKSKDVGDMKAITGEGLRYSAMEMESSVAHAVFKIIEDHPMYQEVFDVIGNKKTGVYFEKAIKEEIMPITTQLCIRQYNQRSTGGGSGSDRGPIMKLPNGGICQIIQAVWPDPNHPVEIEESGVGRMALQCWKERLKPKVKETAIALHRGWQKLVIPGPIECKESKLSKIAVQYAEGIDTQRRSDIIWFPDSGIDPERVLIYFEFNDSQTGRPVSDSVLKEIERRGMRWVCLRRGVTERKNCRVWYPSNRNTWGLKKPQFMPMNKLERWIERKTADLFRDINYWLSFHREFNVSIHYIIGENRLDYIARSMALDIRGKRYGLLAGKQRSFLYLKPETRKGNYPEDLFFTWSTEAKRYLTPNLSLIHTVVTTGYTNDRSFDHSRSIAQRNRLSLQKAGAKFIVALFDNIYGAEYEYSQAKMRGFYISFLEWLTEDQTLGLVIKSKKPTIIDGLPGVASLIESAEKTGRCIRLGSEIGRMPVDASLSSDFFIGVGISSAGIESAVAGCRGVHYDMTNFVTHEFYDWGYERIVFNDLPKLMRVLKEQKKDPRTHPDLGKWGTYLDKLDPYRDGLAGQRMGTYLRWCLEEFDHGHDRDAVISIASQRYKKRWGDDKAVRLTQ